MHFTTSTLALIITLTGVQAIAIENRQAGHVSGQTFSQPGCQDKDIVGTFDFFDDGSNGCKLTNFGASVKAVRVNLNAASRDCKSIIKSDLGEY